MRRFVAAGLVVSLVCHCFLPAAQAAGRAHIGVSGKYSASRPAGRLANIIEQTSGLSLGGLALSIQSVQPNAAILPQQKAAIARRNQEVLAVVEAFEDAIARTANLKLSSMDGSVPDGGAERTVHYVEVKTVPSASAGKKAAPNKPDLARQKEGGAQVLGGGKREDVVKLVRSLFKAVKGLDRDSLDQMSDEEVDRRAGVVVELMTGEKRRARGGVNIPPPLPPPVARPVRLARAKPLLKPTRYRYADGSIKDKHRMTRKEIKRQTGFSSEAVRLIAWSLPALALIVTGTTLVAIFLESSSPGVGAIAFILGLLGWFGFYVSAVLMMDQFNTEMDRKMRPYLQAVARPEATHTRNGAGWLHIILDYGMAALLLIPILNFGGAAAAVYGATLLALGVLTFLNRFWRLSRLVREIGDSFKRKAFNWKRAARHWAYQAFLFAVILAAASIPGWVASIFYSNSYGTGLPYAPAPAVTAPAFVEDEHVLKAEEDIGKAVAFLRDHQHRKGFWGVGPDRVNRSRDSHFVRVPITQRALQALERFQPEGYEQEAEAAAAYMSERMYDKKTMRYWGEELAGTNQELYMLSHALNFMVRQYGRSEGEDAARYESAIKRVLRATARAEWIYWEEYKVPATFQMALVLEALIEARDAGFAIPKRGGTDILTLIARDLEGERNANHGGFGYHYGRPNNDPADAAFRSALIDLMLWRSGVVTDTGHLRNSIDLFFSYRIIFEDNIFGNGNPRHDENFHQWAPYYYALGVYYTSEAMLAAPDPKDAARAREMIDKIRELQEDDGSWNFAPDVEGPSFDAAVMSEALANFAEVIRTHR